MSNLFGPPRPAALGQSPMQAMLNAPMFTVPGVWGGMVSAGNIDLNHRPVAHNPDGSISTVKSVSFNVRGHEVLIPMVVNGHVVSAMQALHHYQQTGQHLGIFNSVAAANRYANALHIQQAHRYGR